MTAKRAGHGPEAAGTPGAGEQGAGELAKRQDAIALKYLDVARAEVLDRMKASNQTLIVYVGGVGAIVGWMYQATIASPHTTDLKELVFRWARWWRFSRSRQAGSSFITSGW